MIERQAVEGEQGAAAEAADWVVRLSQAEVEESDWLEFQAWLRETPERGPAFDAAQALWLEVDRHADVLAAGAAPLAAPSRRTAPPARRPRSAMPRWMMAAAACLALAIVGVTTMQAVLPPAVEYRTGAAERRDVSLPDGARVSLNSNSKITVRYGLFSRKVTLVGAEAAFDVVPDRRRPFDVAINGATVRVVGTEFNIRQHGGDFAVTVRRGVVEVAQRSSASSPRVRLTAGQQLVNREGFARVAAVPAVDDAFSWRTGQLVYRRRPLAEVVDDLNRYFSGDIRLDDPRTGALSFSGVLTLDDEKTVVARLCELLPLAKSEQDGSIVLRAR